MNYPSTRFSQFRYAVTALVVFAALLFSSCSIEKRHYRSGIYLDWNSSHRSIQTELPKAQAEEKVVQPPVTDSISSHSENFKGVVSVEPFNIVLTEQVLSRNEIDHSSTNEPTDSDVNDDTLSVTTPDPVTMKATILNWVCLRSPRL